MNYFAYNLKALRKDRGWSQDQLAETLGIKRQALAAWEKGIQSPTLNRLVQISKIFEISETELLHKKYPQFVIAYRPTNPPSDLTL